MSQSDGDKLRSYGECFEYGMIRRHSDHNTVRLEPHLGRVRFSNSGFSPGPLFPHLQAYVPLRVSLSWKPKLEVILPAVNIRQTLSPVDPALEYVTLAQSPSALGGFRTCDSGRGLEERRNFQCHSFCLNTHA